MKIIRFKFTMPILAIIFFSIAIFAYISTNIAGGAVQAETGWFFSSIPLTNALILTFLYVLSYHVLNSVKVQIISTLISLVVFIPILFYMLSLFIL